MSYIYSEIYSYIKELIFISLLININYSVADNSKNGELIDTLYYNKTLNIANYDIIRTCYAKLKKIEDSFVYKNPLSLIIYDGIPINPKITDSENNSKSQIKFGGYLNSLLSPLVISEVYLYKSSYFNYRPNIIINTGVHLYGYDTLYNEIEQENSTNQYLALKRLKINSIKESYFLKKPFPMIIYDNIIISDSSSTDSTEYWDIHFGNYRQVIKAFSDDLNPEDISSIFIMKNYMNSDRNLIIIKSRTTRVNSNSFKKRKQ